MSKHAPIPSPATITLAQLKAYTAIYPEIIPAHYKIKIKDPKKALEAIQRDPWRYQELPALLHQKQHSTTSPAKDNSNCSIDISQLERLVQWKITHGHNRPFLPGMIRKNNPDEVKRITGQATAQLFALSNNNKTKNDASHGQEAAIIDTLCKLTGVGPATASLIASVYAPRDMPFFADEMFEWLVLDKKEGKLKYDKKEYALLVDAVKELRERLGRVEVGCLEIEQAAFVMMHLDLLEDEEKIRALEERVSGKEEGGVAEKETSEKGKLQQSVDDSVDKAKKLTTKGSKRALKNTDLANDSSETKAGQRRSKRTKT